MDYDYRNSEEYKRVEREAQEEVMRAQAIWKAAREEVAKDVNEQLAAKMKEQVDRWGSPYGAHDIKTWIVILGEEYGKLCKASLEYDGDGDKDKYKAQLIDIAAVATSALQGLMLEEAYDRDND